MGYLRPTLSSFTGCASIGPRALDAKRPTGVAQGLKAFCRSHLRNDYADAAGGLATAPKGHQPRGVPQ